MKHDEIIKKIQALKLSEHGRTIEQCAALDAAAALVAQNTLDTLAEGVGVDENLQKRDAFIVSKGLWPEFVASLGGALTPHTHQPTPAQTAEKAGGVDELEAKILQNSGYSKSDHLSDGETLCAGCWDASDHDTEADNDIPNGGEVYFSSPHPEYGDCDAYCRKCTLERGYEFTPFSVILPYLRTTAPAQALPLTSSPP